MLKNKNKNKLCMITRYLQFSLVPVQNRIIYWKVKCKQIIHVYCKGICWKLKWNSVGGYTHTTHLCSLARFLCNANVSESAPTPVARLTILYTRFTSWWETIDLARLCQPLFHYNILLGFAIVSQALVSHCKNNFNKKN